MSMHDVENEFPTGGTQELMAHASSEKPLDVLPLLFELARRKWWILLCGAVCAAAMYLFTLRLPPRFTASVEILPPNLARGVSAAALLGAGNSADLPTLSGLTAPLSGKPQSAAYSVILQSWPVRQALVEQFGLVQAYHAPSAEDANLMLAANTAMKDRTDGFLTIGVTDTDKKRAAALANGYVEQSRVFLRTLAITEASQRRVFFENQLANTKEDLTKAEAQFQAVQQKTGMISLDSQSKVLLESAAALRAQITAKEVELQSLRSYSTESNAQVQIAESELGALRGQLAKIESSGQGGLTGKGLSSVPGSELTFLRATRELKYQEGLYDLLVRQYEASRIDEAREAPVVQVIEPARIPTHKSGPRRVRDTEYAFFAGVVLAALFFTIRFLLSLLRPETRGRWKNLRRTALGF